MVLDRIATQAKRKLADQSKSTQPSKRHKSAEADNDYIGKSFFSNSCKAAGLILQNGNVYNKLTVGQAVFQRNLQKEFGSQAGPEVIKQFIEGFRVYVEEPKRFHKSLLPCVLTQDDDRVFQGSLIKILLGVDSIQTPLITVLLEKLPEFSEEDCTILEHGEKVDVPHLLMSQLQWLDAIIDSKEVTGKLLEIISITCEDMQREIISSLPNIVQDAEHAQVAMALKDILKENKQLTVPILDAMSNLIVMPELLSEIRESVLEGLASVDLEDLPVLVKFLLQSVTSVDSIEVVTELRANLEFDSSTTKKGSGHRKNNTRVADASSNQDTETVILETVKSAVRFQRHVGDALIKAVEMVKQPGSHKVIDWFFLLILHGTARKKVVESLFRNKIRAGCFTEVYLKQVYSLHAQVLKGFFQSIMSLADVLLRSPEYQVSQFGCAIYKYTFLAFEPYHQQEIVGNLVAHIGSGLEYEIDASLDTLAYLVDNHLPKMTQFAILVKSVLDYLDSLSVCQIRKLYFMLSALAFRNPNEGGLIQDDLHIVIRKQLSNSNPKYKRMGVIGAVMIVSCVAQSSGDRTENSNSEDEISDDLYQQVTSLLMLVCTSSLKSPEAYALFMDELSAIVAKKKLQSKVESWISDNLTTDFQEAYVVDDVGENNLTECGNMPVSLLYRLDDTDEDSIAINILPLVVQKCRRNAALSAYTNSALSDPQCISPSVRLLRVCEEQQHGTLENIDALLGCPVYMVKEEIYEKFESLSQQEKDIILSSLFYCMNWFIEIVNGFCTLSDAEVKAKVITRLQNITELHKLITQCLKVYPSFKPPMANFDIDDSGGPHISVPSTSKGEPKKKSKKSKKASSKEKSTVENDDNSRDSSQINSTALTTQRATQSVDEPDNNKTTATLASYKFYLRELDMSVFSVLTSGPITKESLDSELHTKNVTQLSLKMPQVVFLMEDLCRKLKHALPASSSKRKPPFKVKRDTTGFSILDQMSAVQVVTRVLKWLPAICNHLEAASGFFQNLVAENDGVLDGPGCHSPESLTAGTCFQLLLQVLLSIFTWNGFQSQENRDLLKATLSVLVKRIKSSDQTQLSLTDLVKTSMQYVSNFSNTVPDVSTAFTLIKLLVALTEKVEDKQLSRKLVPIIEEFMKREWLAQDGQKEKGSKFNEQLQYFIRAFIVYSDDSLKPIEAIATKAIRELMESGKDGCSALYPTLNRSSYTAYYRVMFTELIEVVKCIPPVKQTDLFDVWNDRLLRWNDCVRILHILVDLVKSFDGRGCLGICIKYGRMFVEAFLRLGMPLLDHMFKDHRQSIHGLLKNLQLSTRALHHMCGHSKIIKDVSLINQVPMLKKSLEVFVYRVKAMLTVNKCLDAFWIGNLKNRDLHGDEILSQSTVASDGGTGGGDSDVDTLPDDDLSDVELDESPEENVTDPESSYSQVY